MEGKEENGVSVVEESSSENREKSKMKGARDNEKINLLVSKFGDNQDDENEDVNDEDFMNEMDVVDAWEGDEDRLNDDTKRGNHPREREKKLTSRERRRLERRAESRERERLRKEEKKREPIRRDPQKSNKDIERDKIRAKKDSESKLLAEKERAIKHILDSDEVVPPGTEEDAIESIVEKQTQETILRRKSLERFKISPTRRRRVSPYRVRRSPYLLSPERRRISQHRRSPLILSPERRRSPDRRRKPSWDRRNSTERKWSIERQKRRLEQRDREFKMSNRRSRSRDRHRSSSIERRKRYSRSPRRRSHSRSRSPDRRRKRSPFINEIARQLRNEMEVASTLNRYSGPGPVIAGPSSMPSAIGPPGINAPPGMPGGAPLTRSAPFMNFDLLPPGPIINFEPPMPVHLRPPPDFAPPFGPPVPHGPPPPGQLILGPPGLPLPVPSPQPVPAPGISEPPSVYNSLRQPMSQISSNQNLLETNKNPINSSHNSSQQTTYHDCRPSSPYNIHEMTQDERLKTPEPPVISKSKRFEKTSLSSLLEASVSTKDSKNSSVLYPGFRPEILRHCEYALRDLPSEDPRLKMKGRFFFDPSKESTANETAEEASNSILLRKGKNKIDWEDLEESLPSSKSSVQMHQKICQTEQVETASMGVQASVSVAHIGIQVYSSDIHQPFSQPEKRPLTDRLDWSMRETYDYSSKMRDSEDLRWSLSSSQKRTPWGRAISPERPFQSLNEHNLGPSSSLSSNISQSVEHSRNFNSELPTRDNFTRPGNYAHTMNRNFDERINYREERGNFREEMSDEIRGASPMAMDDPPEDLDLEHENFSRESIGSSKAALFFKSRAPREIPLGGRPPARGNFRGKYW
ncbi:serine/arginine repetitive matrix protein 1-like isoform X2 [Leptopilina heterotoma]|uniref:serine/arginine repetitive matrix protein 1-like isoform X2 n=1 Tax=Leptopilina heterotoma TaxID=63436 RepID=UPI001CA91136|nr:serine/arginine repetitive matrix protein 1-like isoform X2 [Leptopilina heterotoma]